MGETPVADSSIVNESIETLGRYADSLTKVSDETQKTTMRAELLNRATALYNANIGISSAKLNDLSQVTGFANGLINKLSSGFQDFNNSLLNSQTMIDASAAKFAMMTTEILGTRDSFNSLSGVDASGLNLFSDQLGDLFKIMKESPGADIAIQAQNAIINMLKKSGVEHSKINSLLTMGTDAMQKFATATLKSADNGLKLQNAMLQQAASSGNFNDMIQKAGDKLQNMNNLLARQDSLIQGSADSTGIARESMNQYWNQLSPTISGMKDLNITVGSSSEKMNVLTAAVTLATGSGRSQKDVIDDVNKATQEYGISVGNALTMTARISEISSKFKIPLQDVRNSLFSTTESFKWFSSEGADAAKKTEGFTSVINKYAQALKDTGLSGHQAIGVVDGMTKSMSVLTMAQKAFLSQQTGGPGGLRGAFQIESMLQKDPAKAFELVRKQMQKQMGGIVSQSEAEGSEAAAQKRQKQMLILQEGPLGKFAQDPQQAMHILDAFKSIQQGKGTTEGLYKDIASQQIKKGEQIQGTSKTPMSELRSTLDRMTFKVMIDNLSSTQRMMTQTAGVDLSDDTAAQSASRRELGKKVVFNNDTTQGSAAIDAQKKFVENARSLKNIHAPAISHGAQKFIGKNPFPIDDKHEKADLAKDIENKKKEKANLPKGIQSLTSYKPPPIATGSEMSADDRASAPKAVGRAVVGAGANKSTESQAADGQQGKPPSSNTNEDVSVQVNVSSICSVCKHEVETSSHVTRTNSAVKD